MASKGQLVETLLKEIDLRHKYLSTSYLKTIYFGGGTPSLLSETELKKIVERLAHYFSWDTSTEITLEANPDDISRTNLRAWKKVGINRLSIGLQSFKDDELKWMNRAHNAKESEASVKMAQDEGFENITIDLIYGSKFQTINSWNDTLQKAISLNTQHISSYNLTIEKKTVLGVNFMKGKEPEVNDDLSSLQFDLMQKELKKAGFIHYEISNFAKEGFLAKHNSNYWLQEHYLGIGPSAHSFNGVSRQWNVKNNNTYIKTITDNTNYFELEELSLNDRYNEYVLTRLRTIWGCDLNEIEKLFGIKYKTHFLNSVNDKLDYFDKKKDVFVLNEQAKFLADGIAADLFF